jgi:hypothetical protein
MCGVDPYYIEWLMARADFYRGKINSITVAYSQSRNIFTRAQMSMRLTYLREELRLIDAEMSSWADFVWLSDQVSI